MSRQSWITLKCTKCRTNATLEGDYQKNRQIKMEFTNLQTEKLRERGRKFKPALNKSQGNKKPIKIQSFVLDFFETGFWIFSPALARLKKAFFFKIITEELFLGWYYVRASWCSRSQTNCHEIFHHPATWNWELRVEKAN